MADDFNIENFPTSETAKRMMTYITGNGFYDKSYVGKWIFQVMGLEWDEAYRLRPRGRGGFKPLLVEKSSHRFLTPPARAGRI